MQINFNTASMIMLYKKILFYAYCKQGLENSSYFSHGFSTSV